MEIHLSGIHENIEIMDKECIYYKDIANRSLLHFLIGLYPRLKQWIKFERARKRSVSGGQHWVMMLSFCLNWQQGRIKI